MERTKLYSVINSKCPVCHEGKMYEHHIYNIAQMGKIKKKCDVCGTHFTPETGFYTGSMYVSYAFSVAIMISVFTAFNVLFEDYSALSIIITVTAVSLILGPLNYRLSRNIWANMYMSYDKKRVKKLKLDKV